MAQATCSCTDTAPPGFARLPGPRSVFSGPVDTCEQELCRTGISRSERSMQLEIARPRPMIDEPGHLEIALTRSLRAPPASSPRPHHVAQSLQGVTTSGPAHS